MFRRFREQLDDEIERDGVLHHYRLLLFFLLYRFDGNDRHEGTGYGCMRKYFARRLIRRLSTWMADWKNTRVLDVGGATGEFCQHLVETCGASCVNTDTDRSKIASARFQPSLLADGAALGFKNGTFDLVLSRGVIEHVPIERHGAFVAECFRVLRPGGLAYLTSSPWLAPWAGHQLAPFHVLPIGVACRLANLCYGKTYRYTSYADADLYYLSFGGFQRMLGAAGFDILHVEDPLTRLDFLTKIPLLREVLVQHMAFVLRRPAH